MSQSQGSENTGKTGISADAGADAGAVETKNCSPDADLQSIIDAWPTLPEAIRAGILAMVDASGRGEPRQLSPAGVWVLPKASGGGHSHCSPLLSHKRPRLLMPLP